MSLRKITSKAFRSTATVQRPSSTKSPLTGEVTNTLATVYTGLPAAFQQLDTVVEFNVAGITEKQTHVCYLNRKHEDANIAIQRNDRLTDTETGNVFRSVGIEQHRNSNQSVGEGHHIMIRLEIVL